MYFQKQEKNQELKQIGLNWFEPTNGRVRGKTPLQRGSVQFDQLGSIL
jgi:hypothetical protein